jgi:hypothetical protein
MPIFQKTRAIRIIFGNSSNLPPNDKEIVIPSKNSQRIETANQSVIYGESVLRMVI